MGAIVLAVIGICLSSVFLGGAVAGVIFNRQRRWQAVFTIARSAVAALVLFAVFGSPYGYGLLKSYAVDSTVRSAEQAVRQQVVTSNPKASEVKLQLAWVAEYRNDDKLHTAIIVNGQIIELDVGE